MLNYITLVLCFMAVAQAAVLSPAKVSRKINNPFGVVEGIRFCASVGVIQEVRVTDCTRVPCNLVTGNTYAIDIVFRVRDSHPQLDIKMILIHGADEIVLLDGALPNSAVEAGLTYTLTYPMQVEGLIQGLSDLRLELSGAVSGVVEACGIAGINILPRP